MYPGGVFSPRVASQNSQETRELAADLLTNGLPVCVDAKYAKSSTKSGRLPLSKRSKPQQQH